MTKQEVNNFEKLQAQLEGLHNEISAISKKSQNDALNTFKLKFVNKIISDSNELLGVNYKPFTDFDKFDESDIPSNSDVAMMLTQYLSCFEKLRADNVVQVSVRWFWIIDGKQSDIKTAMPKKIKEK